MYIFIYYLVFYVCLFVLLYFKTAFMQAKLVLLSITFANTFNFIII